MFYRIAQKNLENWYREPNRKPLILRGARQIGKTTTIKEFSKNFRQSIFLNLETKRDAAFFETFTDAKTLVESLLITYNITEPVEKVLLFIDEIQEMPSAIQMLRYFYEDVPGLAVVAAGSLLEFSLGGVKNMPVGRVEYLYMSPMNFEEFLMASRETKVLEAFHKTPVNKTAHVALMQLFHRYAIIGGMPEIIKNYLVQQEINNLGKTYESIWETYKNDIEKYATTNSEKNVLRHVLNTAPLQVDERIKFQNFGNSNYKSKEVSEAFRSLDMARVIRLIYPTTSLAAPIVPDYKKSPKLLFLDTGIVNYTLRIQAEMLALEDLSDAYRGAIIPQLILQEITSLQFISNYTPNFWVRDKAQSGAEVDLVLAHKKKLVPIEIKSGATGSLKSLHSFIDHSGVNKAIRIYGGEYIVEETKTPAGNPYTLMNLPYYLGTRIYDYINLLFKEQ